LVKLFIMIEKNAILAAIAEIKINMECSILKNDIYKLMTPK